MAATAVDHEMKHVTCGSEKPEKTDEAACTHRQLVRALSPNILAGQIAHLLTSSFLNACMRQTTCFLVHAILGIRPPGRISDEARIPRIAWTSETVLL